MIHAQAKELYLSGKNVTDIASGLGVSRTTIYSYKNKDKEAGIDWDELKFLKATDSGEAQKNEEDFVALLIFQFENALEKLNEKEPEEQVKVISQYINTYYKLKQQKENPKVSKAEVAKSVLKQVSQIALDKQATSVISFLSDHADQIVSAVISR